MQDSDQLAGGCGRKLSLVLYCLVRLRPAPGEPERFLLIEKQGHPAFPPTKFLPAEDLYHALARVMEGDLGLPPQSYFLERELEGIPNSGESPRYPGLAKEWLLHPVTVSLTDVGWAALESHKDTLHWWALSEIEARCQEPNIRAILRYLQANPDRLGPSPAAPSMNAQAGHWASSHPEGVRVARGADSQEAALDQSTMRICRAEIVRCQAGTPRPNFVVLLGDRHGWRPLPDEIPAAEFEALRPHLPAASVDRWYRPGENAVYRLLDETGLDNGRYVLQFRIGEFGDYDG